MAANPTYTLYFSPKSRAVGTRWFLEELGAPYKLHTLDFSKNEHKAAEYLKIHPHGLVPALADHGANITMFESTAILLYLADKHGRFTVSVGLPERAHFIQWMFYGPATMEASLVKLWIHGPASKLPVEARIQKEYEDGLKSMKEQLDVLANALGDKEYLMANQFTAADAAIGGLLFWASMMGVLKTHPKIEAYVARITARPAWKRAHDEK